MYKKSFLFGNKHKSDFSISSTTLYSEERGYGFVDQNHLTGKTKSEQALYSGGWNLRSSAKDTWMDSLSTTSDGVELNHSRYVMIFKVLVPEEGSYRVTLETYAGKKDIENMSVFCGRRNLIERDIHIPAEQNYQKSFYTYVAPYIPAMTSIPCTEKAIYISITGKHAKLSKITIEKSEATVLYIAGDSTLTDQNALFPYYPYGSCAGWGQVLAQYFDSVAVCNQAHSGMTTNCFRDDGHWDIIKDRLKEKDIVMLQFGHNDQKRRNLAAFGGYTDNLRWYIKEIRKKGAYPIIVSPISRIPFEEDGSWHSLLTSYADACRTVASEYHVPFIDLHTLTFHKWCKLGKQESQDYFMKGDITHTNDYGANLIAAFVVSEILRQGMHPLATLLAFTEKKMFLPENDTKKVPEEKSEGNMFDIEIPYLDIQGIPQYDDLVKALRRGLLDPCVMYLHPNEMMPRAQFLMVFFKALRISGKRPYLGAFCDLSKYEWDSAYVQTCIDENLIDFSTVENDRFRPNDALTQEEYASFLIRGIKTNAAERNISLSEAFQEAQEKRLLPESADEKDIITRADCYAGLVRLMEFVDTSNKELPADTEIHPVG